jgi:hypothetical protein
MGFWVQSPLGHQNQVKSPQRGHRLNAAAGARTPALGPVLWPVEQAIRDRGISDPVILLRAAAIDNAAWHLITRAENAASVPSPSDMITGRQHAVGTPAQLAAQSFPHDKAQEHLISSHRAQPSGPSVQASESLAESASQVLVTARD